MKKKWNISNPLYRYMQKNKAKSRGKTTMAKRRSYRRVASRGFARVKRYARRSTSTSNPLGSALLPFIMGAVIPTAVQMAKPLTDKLPLGQYSDEAGLILGGMAIEKFISKSTGKSVKEIGFYELGKSLGSPLVSNMAGGMTTTANPSSSSGQFLG